MTSKVIDRALPERSYLKFYFPATGNEKSFHVVQMPFFENINVKERKKARYQKYSLISRSSNLYSYLGADSRQLDLDFNITLPHIMDLHPGAAQLVGSVNLDGKKNLNIEKNRFLTPIKPSEGSFRGSAFSHGNNYTKGLARDSAKEVLKYLNNSEKKIDAAEIESISSRYGQLYKNENLQTAVLNGEVYDIKINQKKEWSWKKFGYDIIESTEYSRRGFTEDGQYLNRRLTEQEQNNYKYRMIDLLIYWVNIIRSSVLNNSENTMYGPPILRLNHGIMYQDVPCICMDYSLEINEAAGYDVDTLLPRQIKVSMKLEELRTGNFGKFDPKSTNPVVRDNLAGWESVVLGPTGSLDPGSGGL